MSQTRSLPVPDGLVGERVDAALARMLGVARAKVAAAADAGAIEVAGRAVAKSYRLAADDVVDVDMAALADKPVPRALQVLPGMAIAYDDDDIVVVDKPAGVAAHPSHGWDGPNVPDALLAAGFRIATSGAQERQGIVQRLDVGTSGLMVVAKSEQAYSVLKHAFKARDVTKIYTAASQGVPQPAVGTIDAPIARVPGAYKFTVGADGRHAVTHYRVTDDAGSAALLEVGLETGRTHQIRVHFQAIRHPLLGDPTYGGDPVLATRLGLDRQFLHASRLRFAHPITGASVDLTSPLPADLQRAWAAVTHP